MVVARVVLVVVLVTLGPMEVLTVSVVEVVGEPEAAIQAELDL
jgi:hypothetical protein